MLDDIVQDFLIESYENLSQIDQDLMALEKKSYTKETLGQIFRNFHSIKGTSGFFGFTKLQSVTHTGENILSLLRENVLEIHPEIISALLLLVDQIREIFITIEKTGTEGDKDYEETLRQINMRCSSPQNITTETPPFEQKKESLKNTQDLSKKNNSLESTLDTIEKTDSGDISELYVRVDTKLLDHLMNLLGELVLTKNQIASSMEILENKALAKTYQKLNIITSGLQEGMMKMRMQPLKNILAKLTRTVRDVATLCKKEVSFEIQGQETELDKTVIEFIKDPLVHLLRNAIDHGIELPEERQKKGKEREGRITLKAFHENGYIFLEISDDGRGIDLEQIKQCYLKKNILSLQQIDNLKPSEILELLFLPGFSSASEITEISGRGVGLDVVKTNIEKIGGTVEIQSQKEKGTSFKIKIPLTLAIIPSLLVRCQKHFFAIPQASILEIIHLEKEAVLQKLEIIEDFPVYRLRGQILPLIYLYQVLALSQKDSVEEDIHIIVFELEDYQFGLVVDEVQNTQEIVIKKLGTQLQNHKCFGGATILGNGEIALILDITGIAQKSGVLSEIKSRLNKYNKTIINSNASQKQKHILIAGLGPKGLIGIPLSKITRLEEISSTQIEQRVNSHDVIQYREKIMPLIYLDQTLYSDIISPTSEILPIIVYSYQDCEVGIVVHRIIDIIEGDVEFKTLFTQEEYSKPIIFQKKIIDMLNVEKIVQKFASKLTEYS